MIGCPAFDRDKGRGNALRRAQLRKLSSAYWQVVLIGTIFTLARFSEAFLVLKAEEVGTPLALVPLVMVAMHLVYSLSAYPFGALSDRISHRQLLAVGMIVLVLADLALALLPSWIGLAIGVALGIHMGMTQGLLAAMVAKTAADDLRGTAFGMFNLVSGIATRRQRRFRRALAFPGLIGDVSVRCDCLRRVSDRTSLLQYNGDRGGQLTAALTETNRHFPLGYNRHETGSVGLRLRSGFYNHSIIDYKIL